MLAAFFGAAAATLTTAAFVPQVWRTLSTGSTKDLSFWWLAIFSTGLACWLIYGIAIVSWPVIAANAITLGLVLILFALKIKAHWAPTKEPDLS